MTILFEKKFKGRLVQHVHGNTHRQDTYWLIDGRKAKTKLDFLIVRNAYKSASN